MRYIADLLQDSGLLVFQLFGLSIVFAHLLTFTSRRLKSEVIGIFGYKGQVYFGFIGIMLHEFGHFIFAILFNHKINKISLVRLPTEDDGSLGSVSHSFNKRNLLHRVGNYFIGIAPIFLCTFAILGLYLFMFQSSIPLLKENIELFMLEQDMVLFLNSVFETIKIVDYTFWKVILFVIIITNIVIGGFDLSGSDFKAIYSGIIPLFILSIIVTLVINIFFEGLILTTLILGLNVALGVILSISLLISIIMLIFTRLIRTVLYR